MRLRARLLSAPYEICLARAYHFTHAYRATEGADPQLRIAAALKRTLERQAVSIYPDEHLAGTKTEKYLAGLLPVERGDFLRVLELDLAILESKRRPFRISERDRRLFREHILPYWVGRTVRDRKLAEWNRRSLIDTAHSASRALRALVSGARYYRYLGRDGLRKLIGNTPRMPWYELARNNPTPATMCFDVQGHVCLGVDAVVESGMASLIAMAQARLDRLTKEAPGNRRGRSFLEAAITSLQAAIAYSERFAQKAEAMAKTATDDSDRSRLLAIACHCRRVPRERPRSFHEALQSVWLTLIVGEIQYGMHDTLAIGRADQYLYPYYRDDLASGRLTREDACALLQEFFLKLSSTIEPLPEVGTEANSVLGLNPHCVTLGGVTPEGHDATNELSHLMVEAYGRLGGAANQLCVRLHEGTNREFLGQAVSLLGQTNGIAFYNDHAIVKGLEADGLTPEDARNFCIVGCVETCGLSNTFGCPAGQELVLPAVLLLALTRGRFPPAAPGQQSGYDSGDPRSFDSFARLLAGFRRQLAHQVRMLVDATAEKDHAHRELLPAPFVSALTTGCLESATDITAGGARYDFTSIVVRGLATVVDSLMALDDAVYQKRDVPLGDLIRACVDDFAGREPLRQRLIHQAPKYATNCATADAMALRVIGWLREEAAKYRNARGGKYRVAYFSQGSHVIDGFMLGATPDGRRRGEPISNGVSPSNLIELRSPTDPLRTVAQFPPADVSSGVALNLRFHPDFIRGPGGADTFAAMVETYFRLGGMQLQPNVVSTETLRMAQRRPDEYRDLVVKVSGYSAYFVDIGPSMQEDIIARMEFRG